MIIRKVNVLNYSKKISKGAFSPPGDLLFTTLPMFKTPFIRIVKLSSKIRYRLTL